MEWIMKKSTSFNSRPGCQPRHTNVAPCVSGRDDAGRPGNGFAPALSPAVVDWGDGVGLWRMPALKHRMPPLPALCTAHRITRARPSDPGMIQAARNDAGDLTSGVMTVTSSTTCACQLGTTPSAISCASTTSCVTPSRIIQWVRVDISTTIDPLFHYPGLGTTVTVQGHATMRVQQ